MVLIISKFCKWLTLRTGTILTGCFFSFSGLLLFVLIISRIVQRAHDEERSVHENLFYFFKRLANTYPFCLYSMLGSFLVYGAIKEKRHFVLPFVTLQGLIIGLLFISMAESILLRKQGRSRVWMSFTDFILTSIIVFSFLLALNYFQRLPKWTIAAVRR